MDREELKTRIYSKIDELPTLPVVIPRLLRLMESGRSSAADVTKAISQDPALASRILRVSNSAYYGFSRRIASLERAVALLGFNMVKSLALSIGVIRGLPSGKGSPSFSREGLWVHSLAVATAMKELGGRLGKRDADGYLFIVGLLHDIGKVVLDQFFSELFRQALEEARDPGGMGLHVAERRVIGFDHGEVGGMLLTRWNFPRKIVAPISAHHLDEVPEGTSATDVAMLRIADVLPRELGLGESDDVALTGVRQDDIELLELGERDLLGLEEKLRGIEDEIHAFSSAIG